MGNHERLDYFSQKETERFIVKTMIVKIGSSTITAEGRYLDKEFIDNIARQASALFHAGVKVAIVSSGAIANGSLLIKSLSNSDKDRQIAAMYGQSVLTKEWVAAFERHNVLAGELLFPESDLDRTKELLSYAMNFGIPIVNGYDAVNDRNRSPISSDNDRLAGFVSRSIGADTSIFLTDVDGLMDRDGELINFVDRLEDIHEVIINRGSGTGGMWGKCIEAKHLARLGQRSIIANGRVRDVLLRIAKGENIGTRFGRGWMLY